MKVIIPVAGAGTRLKPHTLTLPKVLMHVGGKPVLAHVLDPLMKLQLEEVIFIIGSRGELIKDYVQQNYSFKARFVLQEKLLGLGYALHLALQSVENGPVLVILGDTIVGCDLEKFVKAGDFVLGLRQVEDPHRFGIAEISDGFVASLVEKPKHPRSNLALIGLYYFNQLSDLKKELQTLVQSGKLTRGEIQLTDALQAMINAGTRFVPYEVEEWYDCGKKETLLQTNRHLLQKLPPSPDIEGSILVRPVFTALTARIVNSILGPNVSVAEGAVVENSILKDTIISAQARVKNAILENSLVGRDATVAGETQIVSIGDSSQIQTR
jgi:glucose-1-phosphate thymidylyltransferase